MKVFFGAAIQGSKVRGERQRVNSELIKVIKDKGYTLISEHVLGKNKDEVAQLLEQSIGPLPPTGIDRVRFVRRKMIDAIEGSIDAAIFEVSVPSLGTGVEIAHAYLRPRMGLSKIPILILYEKDYWPNSLSSMIKGITIEEIPNLKLIEYSNLKEAKSYILEFLEKTSMEVIS